MSRLSKLGDLDSNQEWRIQSPLFCRLNYLPPMDTDIIISVRDFQALRRAELSSAASGQGCVSLSAVSEFIASLMRRSDSSLPNISMVSKVGGDTR